MKLTFILIICLSFQSMANVYSQTKISLRLEGVALKKALAAIEEKSDFYFVYSEQKAINQLKVSINSSDEPVLDVLKKMLLNTGYTYEPMANNLIIIKPAGAQQTVSGVIVDETKQPMPGVSVKVKGTTRAVVTNNKGAYSIQANATDVLVINYIGYEPIEETVGSRSTVNFSLVTSNQGLNEVVVVGYGTQQKKTVTNAVSQIKGSDIRQSSAPAITNALAGRVPGLIVNQRNGEPGRDEAAVFIRGLTTNGDSNPLVVIDGVANRTGMARIDPNDIETFTVLKDGSAGIYGAQAANGVILITTRRGKTGASQFNYSFNQGYVSPTRLVKMADAGLYTSIINDLDLQAGRNPSYSADQISQYQSGALPSTNWQEEILKNHSLQSRHSLTMDGGTDAVKYFLSAGLSTQDGLLKNDETTKFKQYNFRSNIDAQASKRLKIGLDLAGRRENINFLQQEQQILFQNALISDPTQPATINGYPTQGRQNANPLAIAQGPGYNKEERNTLNGTLKYTYEIPGVEGLSLDGFAAYDYVQSMRKLWTQPWTYYSQNDAGDLIATAAGPARALDQYFNRNNSLTLNSKINYKRVFGKHDVSGFLAYEQNETRSDNFQASRTGFVSPEVDQLFAGSQGGMQNNGSAIQTARQNYFGRFSYAYDGKYLVQAHFRYDGSQIFPKGERFGLFPGVSLGWVMSEESFLKDNPVISNLKLRASVGKSGNDRIDPFQYLNLYTYGGGYVFGGQDFQALNPGVTANPFITWENQLSKDIGVEAGFFQNKLTFEADVFLNNRTKIQMPRDVTVPQYTGISLPFENIGKIDSKGFETSLTYRGNWQEVNYNIGGNFSLAKSKVIFIDEGNRYAESYQKAEGQPLGSPLLYNVIGVYRNEADLATYPSLGGTRIGDYIFADTNGDGVLNSDDMIRVPLSNTPQIQFGLNLGVSYKGFDLTALIQGQAKAKQYMDYTISAGNNGPEYFLKNAWRPDAANNELARAGRSILSVNNTSFYHDVSFVRLKNLELGYTLPKELLAKIGVKALRFYTNGYNLLTFDGLKKKGLTDPENTNEKGWRYPLTKSINFGANLTF